MINKKKIILDLTKKLVMLSVLTIVFYVSQVYARRDAASELQIRLTRINNFYANFIHKVTSINGDLIHQGEGQLWVKRPNLFNWHMLSPNESWLISDGTNIWFYNPFIEQVTVTLLNDLVIMDTPFILIINNNLHDWKRYHISQNGNDFLLTAKKENKKNLKFFSITIHHDGNIQQFSVAEQDGQINSYQFKNQHNNSKIDNNKFKFTIPHGIVLDDQRLIK